MKKLFLIFIFVIVCVCGCKGDDVRAFKSDGFSLSDNNFSCDYKNTFKLFGSTYAIGKNDELYSISLDLPYSNHHNCKLVSNDIKIDYVFHGDDVVFKTVDNNFYLIKDGKLVSLSDKSESYSILSLFSSEVGISKIIAADSYYFALFEDGSIFSYHISNSDNKFYIDDKKLLFDNSTFNSKILNFNYSLKSDDESIYFYTEDGYYRNHVKNAECRKYADIKCSYSIKRDLIMEKYKDSIFAYDGNVIILNNGKILSFSSNNE